MSEQRLIDANALDVVGTIIPSDADTKSYVMGMEYILNKIDKMPTIEERKTGRWIQDPKSKRYRCDQCFAYALRTDDMQENLSDFCPVCGCKMERKQT